MTTPKDLTEKELATIKARIVRGDKHQDIASDYRLNLGRISDLKYGKIYSHISPADLSSEPEPLKFDAPSNDAQSTNDLFSQNKK